MSLKKVFFVFIFLFCLTGCKGDDIRAFRSEGYSLNQKKFKCSFVKENVKFLTNNNLILEDGTLYDLSLDLIYQNNNNCKLVDENIKVKSIYNNEAFKSNDGKIYSFTHNNNGGYLVNNENKIANYLLSNADILKVINENNDYYILKNDGNVYKYIINDNNSKYSIKNTSVLFDHNNYDGPIVDFNYSNNLDTVFIKTNNTYYRNQIVNIECKKYADVDCIYEISEDKYLNKYKNKILAYDGNVLILKNGQTLTYSAQ